MLKQQFSGKVLFVFSDPGGAKPCLSLAAEKNAVDILVISDRKYSFFNDFGVDVKPFEDNIEQIIDSFKPDLIFTGTSYTSNIESEFVAYAKAKNIKCGSFVDHWTAISNRFLNEENELIFPDFIGVIDYKAKEIAVAEGIDPARLLVMGNPYHEWLAKWNPEITRKEYFDKIGQSRFIAKKIVVFAPDPLSNVDGKTVYGFDELSASRILVDKIDQHINEIKDFVFFVKVHPNQNLISLSEIIGKHPSIVIIASEVNVNETIFFADIVLGFFSSFLLEAKIMRKPIIRFLESNAKNDPFEGFEVGKIVNEKNLVNEILTA